MASMNSITLIGRVGSDPKSRGNDGKIAAFSIATSRTWKDREGVKQERTQWHNIVVFAEHTAGYVLKYIKKGDLVYVNGPYETRQYDKDGVQQTIAEVVIRPFSGEIQSLSKATGSRDSEGGGHDDYDSGSSGRTDNSGYGQRSSSSGGGNFQRDIDDDIPF